MERKQWWGLEVRYTFIMIKFNVYLERSYYILYDCREFKVLWLYRVHMGITQQCCNAILCDWIHMIDVGVVFRSV